jgi:O-glycosyl hydrolase
MGGTRLNPEATKEYAEMMSSMVYYGLKRRKPELHFSMLSPINETTCDGNEGAMMTPEQLGTLFGAIATHLTRDHITALTLIGPDDCGGWAANYHAMVTNPAAMSKIRFFGQHQYGNNTSKGVALLDSVRHSRYPDRGVIMTEANTICRGCDGGSYNSNYGFDQYAGPAYKYILQHLNAGVNGVQIWEGYDSRYHHPNRTLTWSMWGIFAVNDTTRPDVYTQRAHYYVFKQLFRFVKPGFKRIGMSTKLSKMTVSAFYNPASKTIVITGKNDSDQAQDLDGILKNLPASASLKYYYSDEQHHFLQGPDVKVAAGRFSKSVPASSVFTLVGK